LVNRDMQPRLRLLSEQDLDRNPDIEVEPPRLADTIERQAGEPQPVLTGRGFGVFIGVMFAVIFGLAIFQWMTGLTDDIRGARADSAVMVEKCRGAR
jgi:hypothetical protein